MDEISRLRILLAMFLVTLSFLLTALFLFNGDGDGRFFTLFWKLGCVSAGGMLGMVMSYIAMRFKIHEMSPMYHHYARAVYVVGFGLCMALAG